MNPIEIAENCSKNQYCTSCPSRGECPIRRNFYNETKYNFSSGISDALTLSRCLSDGVSYEQSSLILHSIHKRMYEKRQRELEMYPEYSPE